MLLIHDENSIDNTLMLLSDVAEQCLLRVEEDFSASHAALPVRNKEVYKKLEGDTTGTSGPEWPKGYCIQYDAMPSNKTWGEI